VFTDSGTLGPYVNGHEVEAPEAAEMAPARDRDVERRPNLDAVALPGAGDGIPQVLHIVHLGGQKSKEASRVRTRASV